MSAFIHHPYSTQLLYPHPSPDPLTGHLKAEVADFFLIPSVLSHLAAITKYQRPTGWLVNNINLLLTVLEFWKPKIKAPA